MFNTKNKVRTLGAVVDKCLRLLTRDSTFVARVVEEIVRVAVAATGPRTSVPARQQPTHRHIEGIVHIV